MSSLKFPKKTESCGVCGAPASKVMIQVTVPTPGNNWFGIDITPSNLFLDNICSFVATVSALSSTAQLTGIIAASWPFGESKLKPCLIKFSSLAFLSFAEYGGFITILFGLRTFFILWYAIPPSKSSIEKFGNFKEIFA